MNLFCCSLAWGPFHSLQQQRRRQQQHHSSHVVLQRTESSEPEKGKNPALEHESDGGEKKRRLRTGVEEGERFSRTVLCNAAVWVHSRVLKWIWQNQGVSECVWRIVNTWAPEHGPSYCVTAEWPHCTHWTLELRQNQGRCRGGGGRLQSSKSTPMIRFKGQYRQFCVWFFWVCWFVARITQKLFKGFLRNLDGGSVSAQNRPH